MKFNSTLKNVFQSKSIKPYDALLFSCRIEDFDTITKISTANVTIIIIEIDIPILSVDTKTPNYNSALNYYDQL